MRSVVDRYVVIRRTPVHTYIHARPTTADTLRDDTRQEAAAHLPAASTYPLLLIQHPQLLPPHNTVHALRVAVSGVRSGRRAHPSLPPHLLYKVQAYQNKVKPFVPEVELPGDPRGEMTGTVRCRNSTQSAWRPLQSSGDIREVRTRAARSMVYALFVSTVIARGATQLDGY
jgi:hypothetical protein